MHLLDYLVFYGYLICTILIGIAAARTQHGITDFFLAGRRMHWFPIGLSVMATSFSAINYVAFSGEVFGHGLYVLLCLPIFALVAIPITRGIIPFYHSMELKSAYEYLERRFDRRVRRLGSGLFIIWRLFWMATILYIPCKVLGTITGYEVSKLIVLVGSVATVYTTAGGIKAVMWSDVFQFFIFLTGIIIGVIISVSRLPDGFGDLFRISAESGLLKPFFPFDSKIFSFDPHIRITLWSSWIGTFTAFLTRYSADQVVVQRYFTAKSLKNAQWGFHLNYISGIIALLLLAVMGLAIHTFALDSGILGTKGSSPILYFSFFVKSLPPGITGLLIAGLFAAAMSSLDSGINSCCTVLVVDFSLHQASGLGVSPLTFSRLLTLCFGGSATFMALHVGRLGSIFEITNKIINGIGSPLLALLLLGMFSRRANSRGMLIGGAAGIVWSAYLSFFVQDIALHYYAVINLIATLFVCYFCSLMENIIAVTPSSDQLGWTWQARTCKWASHIKQRTSQNVRGNPNI